jgi:hypothetical protein
MFGLVGMSLSSDLAQSEAVRAAFSAMSYRGPHADGHLSFESPTGVTIAAGATVRGIIPDNVVIAGNPGKIVKRLDPPPPLTEEVAAESTTRASIP